METDYIQIDKIWLKQLKYYGLNDCIDFGKYYGLTINDILYKDADYFKFCVEKVKYFILINFDEKYYYSGVFFEHPKIREFFDEKTINELYTRNQIKVDCWDQYNYKGGIMKKNIDSNLDDSCFDNFYNENLDFDHQDERFYETSKISFHDEGPDWDDYPVDYEYYGTLIEYAERLNANCIELNFYHNTVGHVSINDEMNKSYKRTLEKLRVISTIDKTEKINNLFVIGFEKSYVVINENHKKECMHLLKFEEINSMRCCDPVYTFLSFDTNGAKQRFKEVSGTIDWVFTNEDLAQMINEGKIIKVGENSIKHRSWNKYVW